MGKIRHRDQRDQHHADAKLRTDDLIAKAQPRIETHRANTISLFMEIRLQQIDKEIQEP